MLNPHWVDHALRGGFGMALVATLALVHGCAPLEGAEGEDEGSVEPSSAETADELQFRAPPGLFKCTLSGGLITGTMVAYPGPWGNSSCTIFAPELLGSSQQFCNGTGIFATCPDCQELRASLACPFREPIR